MEGWVQVVVELFGVGVTSLETLEYTHWNFDTGVVEAVVAWVTAVITILCCS